MLKRFAFLTGMLFIMYGGTGCATVSVWRWAYDDHEGPRQVKGITVEDHSTARFLVIAYGPVTDESTLLVPLDSNGKPVAPYAYSDGQHPNFLQNVTPQQAAWELYEPVAIHRGTVVPTLCTVDPNRPQESLWTSGVRAIGYRIDPGDRLVAMTVENARADRVHCSVVIVPPDEARLIPKRLPAACLATPFTVAVDAVVTPVALPFAILFAIGKTHWGP